MVDGPVQNMLPVLLEEKGQPARYYGYLLALINACCVVVPGLVSILSVKYNAYRVAAVAMIAAIVTGCMAFGVNQTYLLIAVLVVLACARTGFNYSLGMISTMRLRTSTGENTLQCGIYSCMEEFLWGCFWADCS